MYRTNVPACDYLSLPNRSLIFVFGRAFSSLATPAAVTAVRVTLNSLSVLSDSRYLRPPSEMDVEPRCKNVSRFMP